MGVLTQYSGYVIGQHAGGRQIADFGRIQLFALAVRYPYGGMIRQKLLARSMFDPHDAQVRGRLRHEKMSGLERASGHRYFMNQQSIAPTGRRRIEVQVDAR